MAVYIYNNLMGNTQAWLEIKNNLKKNDTIIFMGEVIKDSKDSWYLLKDILLDDRTSVLAHKDDYKYQTKDGDTKFIKAVLKDEDPDKKILFVKWFHSNEYYWHIDNHFNHIIISNDNLTPVLHPETGDVELLHNLEADSWDERLNNFYTIYADDQQMIMSVNHSHDNHKIQINSGLYSLDSIMKY